MSRYLILLFVLAAIIVTMPLAKADEATWRTKVDQRVLAEVEGGSAEFLLVLNAHADLSGANRIVDKAEKSAFVFNTLRAFAEQDQQTLLAELEKSGVPHRAFWIANVIWVDGDVAVLQQMARSPLVEQIVPNQSFAAEIPQPEPTRQAETVEWNIAKIGAPEAWELGVTGAGVVIAGQDTGYEWTHPALKNSYRGWNGTTADHNYNWHDAITTGSGGRCGLNSPEPCDDFPSWHGTHTMGTMVGNDGNSAETGWPASATNAVGVAPGATWIGCRNMDQGNGTPTTYMDCFEWFIAPTDLNDTNPDPSQAPHVINNSWSCPTSEGCIDPNVMKQVIENTRAAGIFVAVAASNSGPTCSSVSKPPAIYDASFAVGSVDSTDVIAGSSARGPVTVDGSNRLKPDISAPGVGIRSTTNVDSYGTSSGTSMASPHVAGLVALLIDANPALAGQVDQLEAIIRNTAMPLTTTELCGGTNGVVPNNVYGFGRIDALAAVQSQLIILEPASFLPAIHNS
jgi:subtilisin family serine protease